MDWILIYNLGYTSFWRFPQLLLHVSKITEIVAVISSYGVLTENSAIDIELQKSIPFLHLIW
jgi:hypothetical protein